MAAGGQDVWEALATARASLVQRRRDASRYEEDDMRLSSQRKRPTTAEDEFMELLDEEDREEWSSYQANMKHMLFAARHGGSPASAQVNLGSDASPGQPRASRRSCLLQAMQERYSQGPASPSPDMPTPQTSSPAQQACRTILRKTSGTWQPQAPGSRAPRISIGGVMSRCDDVSAPPQMEAIQITTPMQQQASPERYMRAQSSHELQDSLGGAPRFLSQSQLVDLEPFPEASFLPEASLQQQSSGGSMIGASSKQHSILRSLPSVRNMQSQSQSLLRQCSSGSSAPSQLPLVSSKALSAEQVTLPRLTSPTSPSAAAAVQLPARSGGTASRVKFSSESQATVGSRSSNGRGAVEGAAASSSLDVANSRPSSRLQQYLGQVENGYRTPDSAAMTPCDEGSSSSRQRRHMQLTGTCSPAAECEPVAAAAACESGRSIAQVAVISMPGLQQQQQQRSAVQPQSAAPPTLPQHRLSSTAMSPGMAMFSSLLQQVTQAQADFHRLASSRAVETAPLSPGKPAAGLQHVTQAQAEFQRLASSKAVESAPLSPGKPAAGLLPSAGKPAAALLPRPPISQGMDMRVSRSFTNGMGVMGPSRSFTSHAITSNPGGSTNNNDAISNSAITSNAGGRPGSTAWGRLVRTTSSSSSPGSCAAAAVSASSASSPSPSSASASTSWGRSGLASQLASPRKKPAHTAAGQPQACCKPVAGQLLPGMAGGLGGPRLWG